MSLMEEALKRFDVYLCSLAKPPQLWQGTPIGKVLGICKELFIDALRYMPSAGIDTIDCHGLQAAIVGFILSFRYRFKFCVTMLALYDFKTRPLWFRWICEIILNRADKIFVEGETGKQDLLDCGVKEEKIVKFMHWVDLDVFRPKWKKEQRALRVLYVGRPIPIKGKHIVEELEHELFDSMEFTYVENVPHAELIKHYQDADVLIVPSQYSEGFPRVVFEAAACGCAIIASDRGALPELVKPFGMIGNYSFHLKNLNVISITSHCLFSDRIRTRRYAERFFSPRNAEVILREY